MRSNPVIPLIPFLLLLAALAATAALPAAAQQQAIPYSLATADGFLAPLVHPGAMSFGNSTGIAYLQEYDEQDIGSRFALFLNLPSLAYVLQNLDQGLQHTIAVSSRTLTDLYLGANVQWVDEDVAFTPSLLYRPLDMISLGFSTTFARDASPSFRLGTGLRPFFFHDYLKDRITLTADVPYVDDDWKAPLLSLQTEPVNGFFLDLWWDSERTGWQVDVGFGISHFRGGSYVSFPDEGGYEGGTAYGFLSEKTYRWVRPVTGSDIYRYEPAELVERKPVRSFGPFTITGGGTSLPEFFREIEKARTDRRIEGILFVDPEFPSSMAEMLEVRQTLDEFRESGKQVFFYFHNAGNLQYTLAASSADGIYLHPQGSIDLRGILIAQPYAGGLLSNLGIELETIRSHERKSAFDPFTETGMSGTERENLTRLVDGLYREQLEEIRRGRGEKLRRPVEEIVDDGPYLVARTAMENGLVDDLIHDDQLEAVLRTRIPDSSLIDRLSPETWRYDWSEGFRSTVAVIYVLGRITTGDGLPGSGLPAGRIADAIRRAREDGRVAGIILRVDTGGGSTMGSDIIAREVELTTRGKDAKPIIVSMGATAASGGYYVSAPADAIVAHPVTVTGSIGVISAYLNLRELFDRIQVNWDTVSRGEHADMGAIFRGLSDEEIRIVRESVDASYARFVEIVARGRDMTEAEVREVAEARLWTGRQALERGLVDELGGLKQAVSILKTRAGIQGDVSLVDYTERESGLVRLDGIGLEIPGANAGGHLLPLPAGLMKLLQRAEEITSPGERVLYLMPYEVDAGGTPAESLPR